MTTSWSGHGNLIVTVGGVMLVYVVFGGMIATTSVGRPRASSTATRCAGHEPDRHDLASASR